MNDFLILVPVYRKKLADWKSGESREKSEKMIVTKKWPPCEGVFSLFRCFLSLFLVSCTYGVRSVAVVG